MIKNANSTVIGSFIVGAILLILVVFLIFGTGKFFVTTHEYVAYFRSAPQGLNVGASVKLGGVKIGQVTKITPIYDTQERFTVEVILETMEGIVRTIGDESAHLTQKEYVHGLIEKGFKAQLESESMVTGKLFIKLDFFPNEKIVIEGYNEELIEIPTIPNTFELLEKDAKKIFDRLSKIEFEDISNNLNNLLVGIDSLVRAPVLYRNMEEMAENLALTQNLITKLDSSVVPVTQGFVNVTESVNSTLEQTQALLIRLENVAANNRYEIHLVLEEIKKTSESLRNLLDHLQRDPSSALYGK